MQDKTKDVISIALAGLVLIGLLYGKENKRNKIESTSVTNIENQLLINATMKDTWYEVSTLIAPFDEKTNEYYAPEGENFYLYKDKLYKVVQKKLFQYPAVEIVENGVKYYTAPYGGTPEGNVVICQYETILEAEEAKAVLLELGYLNKEYIKKLEK